MQRFSLRNFSKMSINMQNIPFNIRKSKRGHRIYSQWIKNMSQNIVYIYNQKSKKKSNKIHFKCLFWWLNDYWLPQRLKSNDFWHFFITSQSPLGHSIWNFFSTTNLFICLSNFQPLWILKLSDYPKINFKVLSP